ncbi:DUF3149 domain-containing protein [Comamonas thiooxydans]|nr:DUF3149 domain-containing protein [Comamonas thiooxydans]UUE96451.1 DUF3149 domain-containing protein [Comamonas thiooxydans]
MKLMIDLFSTDYGLMSLAVILLMRRQLVAQSWRLALSPVDPLAAWQR